MRKSLLFLFSLLLLLPAIVVLANETIIIQGKITDNTGKVLVGANVIVLNTNYGSSTDENGFYLIEISESDLGKELLLKIQYVGYITQTKMITLDAGICTYDFRLEVEVLSIRPIIVNAQRREEDLQKVPISIAAVSAKEMYDRGAERMIDLQNSIPNFYVGTGELQHLTYTSIRGISGHARAAGTEARASYYIDDVYAGRPYAVNRDLIDLNQVEILRGPQGTLFGKNTVSGAIHYTTKKPHGNWENTIGLNTGNFNYVNAYTIINAPLVNNKLFARFSGKIMNRDGYLKNLYNNQDLNGWNIKNWRFQLRYLPNSTLDIILSLSGLRERRERRTAAVAIEGFGFDVAPDPREVSHDAKEYGHRDIYSGALTVSYQFLNKYIFKSITAYQHVKYWELFDEDSSPLYIGTSERNNKDYQYTQELRFSTSSESNFNFITGLFYFYQKTKWKLDILTGPSFAIPDYKFYSDGPATTISVAGYFSCNYKLFPTISLSGGLRYTYEDKKIRWMSKNEPAPLIFIDVENYTDTYSQGVFTPRLCISYFPSNKTLLYSSVSQGYTSGGWANGTVSSLDNLTYKPEFVTSYEIGYKSILFKNQIRFNVSLFFERFKDFQVEIWRRLSTGENNIFFTNAAKVTSKGLELELSAVPWKNLSLSAGLGYTNARYDEFKNGGGVGIHYDGNRLERAPETEYSFTVKYSRQIDWLGIITINSDFIHKDRYYSEANNEAYNLIPGYEIINGKIGFQTISRSIGVYLWGKNLTDNLYMLEKTKLFLDIPVAWYAIPRTFGIELIYNFFK